MLEKEASGTGGKTRVPLPLHWGRNKRVMAAITNATRQALGCLRHRRGETITSHQRKLQQNCKKTAVGIPTYLMCWTMVLKAMEKQMIPRWVWKWHHICYVSNAIYCNAITNTSCYYCYCDLTSSLALHGRLLKQRGQQLAKCRHQL